jgi:hypothetical protein
LKNDKKTWEVRLRQFIVIFSRTELHVFHDVSKQFGRRRNNLHLRGKISVNSAGLYANELRAIN